MFQKNFLYFSQIFVKYVMKILQILIMCCLLKLKMFSGLPVAKLFCPYPKILEIKPHKVPNFRFSQMSSSKVSYLVSEASGPYFKQVLANDVKTSETPFYSSV